MCGAAGMARSVDLNACSGVNMNAVDVSETGPVEGWFEAGEAWIDGRYGQGFSKLHPQLLAAYVQGCAVSAVRTALTDDLVNGLDAIAAGVSALAHRP